ncbi:MAG: ribonuclease HII [uncultured bacterium]|nr:MAG: ribonuclease HII [uncultured bacterium]KKT02745.1 MAG: ribonuclease HII, ribonuclease HII [Candidatus Peregrinibacteria bacterium GW2011_GWF2_43_17]KKT20062.1 MAG: Ribonuclease HII [Candidatus Peregrinibacteria bacterium GW2011_GWA2_43_8]HAU39745.1 ribonuclease HII [Candidatus Peregrinibacteria bacterium]
MRLALWITIGIDEAGRGPFAGPLVVSACFLPKNIRLPGLNDSKKLSLKQRERLFKIIKKRTTYGIGIATEREVEKGMINAMNLACKRALRDIKIKPDLLLIDGRDKLKLPYKYKSIIRGDQKERCIMAASIMAKVTRDRIMEKMHEIYPLYGFREHKGYGTAKHIANIRKHGICAIHRKNFIH